MIILKIVINNFHLSLELFTSFLHYWYFYYNIFITCIFVYIFCKKKTLGKIVRHWYIFWKGFLLFCDCVFRTWLFFKLMQLENYLNIAAIFSYCASFWISFDISISITIKKYLSLMSYSPRTWINMALQKLIIIYCAKWPFAFWVLPLPLFCQPVKHISSRFLLLLRLAACSESV